MLLFLMIIGSFVLLTIAVVVCGWLLTTREVSNLLFSKKPTKKVSK